MFKIITVIEKHYVRTEFFKTFQTKHTSAAHVLDVLHNGIQSSLEDLPDIGPSVEGSDQGKIPRISVAIASSIPLIIAVIPRLIIPVVIAIVRVVSGVRDQSYILMSTMKRRHKLTVLISLWSQGWPDVEGKPGNGKNCSEEKCNLKKIEKM